MVNPVIETANKPIVVCGPARSGTTAVSVMLNEHADFFIGREVPLARLPSLRPLLSEIAEYHGENWTESRRAEVVRGLWLAASRPFPVGQPNARRWGMKTPWAELDRDLWDPLVEPLYVYVLRRGDRVFQSHLALGWSISRSPARLVNRYKESVKAGEEMCGRGSAHIVQLDLADDRESRWKLAADLFRFLGEDIDAGVERFVEEWPTPAWSHATSDGRTVNLPREWKELLAADNEYQEMMAAHGY